MKFIAYLYNKSSYNNIQDFTLLNISVLNDENINIFNLKFTVIVWVSYSNFM